MRRALGGLGATALVSLVVLIASGCAAPKPPAPATTPEPAATNVAPAPVAAATPVALPRTLEDAEPALVALEDRREFDAGTLEGAASTADPAVRARAALAAGRIGDERAAALLTRLLGDSAPEVRRSAAFGAGILGDPSMVRALIPLLEDSDEGVAARAAWSLGFLEQEEGRDAILAALAKSSAGRRPALLFALWRFPTPGVAAAVEPHLADAGATTHTAALYALSRRPQAVSLAVVTRGLSDPDTNAAALCARALGLLGQTASIEPLAAALEDRRAPVVTASLVALAAVLDKNAGAALPEKARVRALALAGDANPNLAVPALALLRWGAEDPGVFHRMWSIATSGRGRRRQVAIEALMGGLGKDALTLATTASTDPDPFIRATVAASASSLPLADANALREKLILDRDAVVRIKVLEGLKRPEEIRDDAGLLRNVATDPDPAVRATLLDVRAQAGGPGVDAMLLEAVKASYEETAPDVAQSAIGAAEQRPGDPEARAVVEAAYRSPSTLVSRLARRSLVRIFHVDRATLPWRTYDTGKSVADYAALLKEARSGWTARVETARGTFSIRLAGTEAPLTVMNLVALAQKQYFDGAPIHRVVPGFVVQDGDPTGTGSGGPGYEIRDELSPLPYRTGTLGMALSGPDTGGSQWFVTQAPQPHLDGGYTVFGQIVAGQDVANRIEQDDRILHLVVRTGEP